MLQPTPYPDHYLPPKKLLVLEKQAEALGQKQNFYRVPQTTFFHDGVNNAGVEMKASTCTGQDSTGLNDGSKNSVLVNYISDAWNWGAEIFCECEVRYISKDPRGGYIIYYAWHGVGREKFEHVFHENLMWVRAVSTDLHTAPLVHGLMNTKERAVFPRSWIFGYHGDPPPLSGTWLADVSHDRAEAVWEW